MKLTKQDLIPTSPASGARVEDEFPKESDFSRKGDPNHSSGMAMVPDHELPASAARAASRALQTACASHWPASEPLCALRTASSSQWPVHRCCPFGSSHGAIDAILWLLPFPSHRLRLRPPSGELFLFGGLGNRPPSGRFETAPPPWLILAARVPFTGCRCSSSASLQDIVSWNATPTA